MRVVALDFDGVICDSAREVFVVALRTYASLVPESWLAAEVAGRGEPASWHRTELATDSLGRAFSELMPLGNRAEDFGVSLRAIDSGVAIPDQQAYDAFYRGLDSDWLIAFHASFYEQRAALRGSDPDTWLALHDHYPTLSELLGRHSERARLAIATAKDAVSVRLLLRAFGIDDLFPGEAIADKETGIHKTDHLGVLRDRFGTAFEEMIFVDDKVNHLLKVAPLGVRPVLAAWGFNTPREHAEARRLGYEVATLDTAEAVLFERED